MGISSELDLKPNEKSESDIIKMHVAIIDKEWLKDAVVECWIAMWYKVINYTCYYYCRADIYNTGTKVIGLRYNDKGVYNADLDKCLFFKKSIVQYADRASD